MKNDVNTNYTVIDELAVIGKLQPESIVSRTSYKGDRLNAILFGFDTEQELSERTSS